jgi:C4-dicarboxylate transporter DctM subunit
LIAVPLFIPIFAPFNIDLVWFGIISVIAIEIGLLTPPVGLTCYVVKSTLNDDRVSLADIFIGAAPFAVTMLIVLILLVAVPDISVFLLYIK